MAYYTAAGIRGYTLVRRRLGAVVARDGRPDAFKLAQKPLTLVLPVRLGKPPHQRDPNTATRSRRFLRDGVLGDIGAHHGSPMPRCRFVDPTREVRLSLSDGDWIVIRHELTVGHMRDLARAMRDDQGIVDTTRYPIARALAYLVSWSFVDQSGNVAPLSAGALEFLESSTLTEISEAINAHEEALVQEKKRMTTTATASDPILQSVAS